MIGPIKPSEVIDRKVERIPDFVFTAINSLITDKFRNDRAHITCVDIRASTGFSKHAQLDIEAIQEAYGKAGWKVKYESPDRDESFDSYFEFKKVQPNDD